MGSSGRRAVRRVPILLIALIAGAAIATALLIQTSQGKRDTHDISSQTVFDYPAGLVSVTVGKPTTFNMTLGSSSAYTTFAAEQIFPLTITSPQTVPVSLSAESVPSGVWVHFAPNHLDASPAGSKSQLIIAGAVQPLAQSSRNQTISIRVSYGNSSTNASFTIIRWLQLSIIHSPGPIEFANYLVVGSDSASSETYGAVYDPIATSPNSTLVVNFNAVGIMENGKIVPLPSWLRVLYSNQSLSLVPNKPTYFSVGASPHNGLPGDYVLVIQESINGEQFTTNLGLTISSR
jgi:archaellin